MLGIDKSVAEVSLWGAQELSSAHAVSHDEKRCRADSDYPEGTHVQPLGNRARNSFYSIVFWGLIP